MNKVFGSRKMLRYGLRNIAVSWQGDQFPVFSGNQLSKSAINTKLLRTKFQDNLYSGGQIWRDRFTIIDKNWLHTVDSHGMWSSSPGCPRLWLRQSRCRPRGRWWGTCCTPRLRTPGQVLRRKNVSCHSIFSGTEQFNSLPPRVEIFHAVRFILMVNVHVCD